jgi:CxxC motif-containing protein
MPKSLENRWPEPLPPPERDLRVKKVKQKVVSEPLKHYICIVCPESCELETDGTEVSGAGCKRGEKFARQEVVLPLRVITTTVRFSSRKQTRIIPVKTASPVPLKDIPAIMRRIKGFRLRKIPPIGSRIKVDGDPEPIELIITGE